MNQTSICAAQGQVAISDSTTQSPHAHVGRTSIVYVPAGIKKITPRACGAHPSHRRMHQASYGAIAPAPFLVHSGAFPLRCLAILRICSMNSSTERVPFRWLHSQQHATEFSAV
jgi:hypothetical protein